MANTMMNWKNNDYSFTASVCPSIFAGLRAYHQPYIFKPIYH